MQKYSPITIPSFSSVRKRGAFEITNLTGFLFPSLVEYVRHGTSLGAFFERTPAKNPSGIPLAKVFPTVSKYEKKI